MTIMANVQSVVTDWNNNNWPFKESVQYEDIAIETIYLHYKVDTIRHTDVYTGKSNCSFIYQDG